MGSRQSLKDCLDIRARRRRSDGLKPSFLVKPVHPMSNPGERRNADLAMADKKKDQIAQTTPCGSTWVSRTLRWGQYSPDLFGNLGECVIFQVLRVAVEFADALGELLRRHCVLVVHPAKGLFIQMEP